MDETAVGELTEGFFGGQVGKRWYCTAMHPLPASWKGRSVHMDAREIGWREAGNSGDCYATYECPHCGSIFENEIPR